MDVSQTNTIESSPTVAIFVSSRDQARSTTSAARRIRKRSAQVASTPTRCRRTTGVTDETLKRLPRLDVDVCGSKHSSTSTTGSFKTEGTDQRGTKSTKAISSGWY